MDARDAVFIGDGLLRAVGVNFRDDPVFSMSRVVEVTWPFGSVIEASLPLPRVGELRDLIERVGALGQLALGVVGQRRHATQPVGAAGQVEQRVREAGRGAVGEGYLRRPGRHCRRHRPPWTMRDRSPLRCDRRNRVGEAVGCAGGWAGHCRQIVVAVVAVGGGLIQRVGRGKNPAGAVVGIGRRWHHWPQSPSAADAGR